jgi:methyltransferase family protein
MNTHPFLKRALTSVCILAFAVALSAQTQTPTTPFEPTVGQAGKDVVWVPSPDQLVQKMLDMAKVTPQDLVMDLGSGDGRTVIMAAKRGATAIGVEYNPEMVTLSRANAQKQGVTGKATFVQADLFQTDLTKPTVITMFLLPSINLKLRPTLLNLKPGTRIVSNTFDMEDWQADETATVGPEGCTSWCKAMLWIVPAKAEGRWKTPQGELNIVQKFQMISGTLGSTAINGKLVGDQITFTAGATKYTGRVTGTTINGGNLSATKI